MGTVLSDQIRALARNALERGDITRNVKDDLCVLARDVEEVERERDERCVVTMDEHGRVVDVYIDFLTAKAVENDKLKKLVLDMWNFYCVLPDKPHTRIEEVNFSVDIWKRMREIGVIS